MLKDAANYSNPPKLLTRLLPRGELLILLILASSLLLAACGALPNTPASIYSLTFSNNPVVVEDVYPTHPLQGAAVSYRLGLDLGENATIKQGQVLQVTLQASSPADIAWSANNLPRLSFGSTELDLHPANPAAVSPGDTPLFQAFVPVGVELPAQAYPLEIYFQDATGAARQLRKVIQVEQVSFPYQDLTLDGDMAELADHQADDYDNAQLAAVYQIFSPARLWQGDWQLPLNVAWTLTTAFGEQRTYNANETTLYYHEGVDMGNISRQDGDPVLAPAAGKVVYVGELEARGLTVAIDHGLGVTSYYFHLSGISVEPGQSVAPGELLGRVGSTGRATGPHLHWEVRVQGVPVNPFSFVGRPQV
jgi:murein DD-endopeptidase MepM/ murein hydrolase activator NlpD